MQPKQNLNAQQQEAVEHFEGPLLVLAGAGSGKTHAVTCRIVQLMEQGVSADAILGLTFTNKAAEEMRERVRRRTHHHVLVSTFHSFGAKLLREFISALGHRRDFIIYDAEDAEHVLKSCIANLEVKDEKAAVKSLKTMISRAKNDLLAPGDIVPNAKGSKVERAFPAVYAAYQEKLSECHAVDFDDLLFLPVRLFREHPEVLSECHRRWPFILVDEFQDTNEAQYQLVRMLAGQNRNLCVVGDPDQSIYSWRGANVNNILDFTRDYPDAKVIKLEQNYRSTNSILQAANALIEKNQSRLKKSLWSTLGEGEKPLARYCQSEQHEVQYVVREIRRHHEEHGVPYAQQVIFYRTNFQSRAFEDELLRQRIPYVIIGGVSFYQRREVKDILAFLRMVQSNSDLVSFTRTVNLPKRGIGDKTVHNIQQAASAARRPLFEFVEDLAHDRGAAATIRLSKAQKMALLQYVDIIRSLKEMIASVPLSELVSAVIDKTGYMQVLRSDPDTADDRVDNIKELVSKAAEWEARRGQGSLEAFLEELSLKSSADEAEGDADRLNLMTLHNGKGLEFEIVFLVGMEEGLFPHISARESREEMEEERRLCYVGMTRAKKQLYMTMARYRYLWGTGRSMYPSCFLREVPSDLMVIEDQGAAGRWPRAEKTDEEWIDTASDEDIGEVANEPFAVGDNVFHKQFGIGAVKKAYTGSLGLTYEIYFTKEHASKTIVAKYANLTKL